MKREAAMTYADIKYSSVQIRTDYGFEEMYVCSECSAIVFNTLQHSTFHLKVWTD